MTRHVHHILVLMLMIVFVTGCMPASTSTALSTAAPSVPTTAPTESMSTAIPAATAASPTATSAAPTEPVATDVPAATALPPAPTAPAATAEAPSSRTDQVVGTVVRFSAESASVDVTVGEDNPAVRDFLSMLPLTLTLEEFAGREKISYLPRELAHAGSPGSDPEDGDLIYYTPWGNLGFYYNAAGIDYSDQTIHFGTYDASLEQLEQLEGPGVIVEVVR